MSNIGTAGDPRRHRRGDAFRTPLKNARGLGSGKTGTGHFWWQRVTAVALVLLVAWLLGLLVSLVGADLASVRAALARPWNAIAMAALVVAMFWHAKLGIQVVIEDYVHTRWAEVALQLLNLFACVAGALACLYAIARIAFLATPI
ncbi:MAG TPA: succinate dehydrogenase, hydrophobic membrane anchor protein [Luteimonas sp.]|jgi:succinate dehydrogenase / fumarate reductase membrane anchor subunit|nr:succinate dehydrogenase, hydrophobic membrane anchor protein [Luteimonas sp.]